MDSNKTSNIVLFSRTNQGEDQEDIWDDRALIRAYDRSIRKIKKEISSKIEPQKEILKKKEKDLEEEDEVDDEEEEEEEDENEYEEENEGYYDEDEENEPNVLIDVSNLKKRDQNEWKEEDLCLAVYSQDGLLYPANIIKIFDADKDTKRKKCIVKYLYYLNEEEKYLDELYEKNDLKEQKTEIIEKKAPKSKPENESLTKGFDIPKIPSAFSIPPPPLPFNLLKGNETVSDEDALHSMLLSWYMSGYHTGYYLGLTQGKNIKK